MTYPESAQQLNLDIDIRIADSMNYGNGLQIRQQIRLTSLQFLEVAQILGRFNELAESIKAEHNGQ